ncbi:MAG: hypothetical protein RIR76_190 [Verrucomicrobiota bacterium]|jgi:hypothetical protein
MSSTASAPRFPEVLFTLRRQLPWLNLPAGALLALLQRTPAVQTVIRAGEQLVASRGGEMLRAAFTAASLGALHSRAGATTFIATQGSTQIINATPQRTTLRNPATGTVGSTLTPVVFTYTGTPSAAQYWVISGTLPAGLTISPAPNLGVVRSPTPTISGTPTQAGNFTFRAQGVGTGGQGTPEPIVFAITGAAATAPSITAQPQTQTARAGGSVTFSATASAAPEPAYQWQRNGVAISGATGATLTLNAVSAAEAGLYRVVVSNSAGSVTSSEASLTVYAPNPAARLANLSVRTALAAGDTLIVGLSVGGGSRGVLVRAVGPTLGAFGVGGAMTDPRLELYNGQIRVFANDDWPQTLSSVFPTVGAFALGNGSKDAGFLQTVEGTRSIMAQGTGAGVVLVEAYDTGAPSAARLVNVSARNRVGTGDDILIAGFNISGPAGTAPKPLLIRAVGPGLAALGVPGTLADPKLEIFDSGGAKVVENDSWNASLAAVFSSVGAFALPAVSRDAALVVSLPPGTYTAQVSGVGGLTGDAIIEVYELP